MMGKVVIGPFLLPFGITCIHVAGILLYNVFFQAWSFRVLGFFQVLCPRKKRDKLNPNKGEEKK